MELMALINLKVPIKMKTPLRAINPTRFFIIMLVAMGIISGCKKKSEGPSQGIVLKAYRLIDENRDDEAIDLLESELKRDPKNSEIKFILASAYAHKAGFKIQKLVPTINQTYNLKKLSRKKIKEKPIKKDTLTNNKMEPSASLGSRNTTNDKSITTADKNNTSTTNSELPAQEYKVESVSSHSAFLLNRLSATLDLYSSIPSVTNEKTVYLKQALYTINSIGEAVTQEQALYRAILNGILLKTLVESSLKTELISTTPVDELHCKIDFKKFNEALITTGNLVASIYKDFSLANPNQSEKLLKMREEVAKEVKRLETMPTTEFTLDLQSELLLKQMTSQVELGNLIKCKDY